MSVLGAIGLGPFDAAWLATALVLTTPILLASVGELISERAGVLNVGLEGMLLVGAFAAYLITWRTESLPLGLVAGVGAGLLFGVIMALLTVEAKSDQIVAGIGINLAAFGLTGFGFDQVFGGLAQVVVPTVGDLPIPVLVDIPVIGRSLFGHDPILYLAFLLVPVAWFVLYRTKWGLAVRAAGEMPAAADTAGISVRRVRWMAILLAGGLAGLAGAYLAIVEVGIFRQGMSGGRGFLALVAVIFGRWHPTGVLAAALVLGATDALQLRLATSTEVPRQVWLVIALAAGAFLALQLLRGRGAERRRAAVAVVSGVAAVAIVLFVAAPAINLPAQVWRSLPFLLALVVLAGALTRSHMPRYLAIPYARGET